jgi:uncharacterized phiE125 gp8 family phage protein
MGLEVSTAPTIEPVTLIEVKDFLRVTGTDDDALISELIVAARRAGEDFTRRTFITTTYKLSLDDWPSGSTVDDGLREGTRIGADLRSEARWLGLPKPPLQTVTSVTTFDDGDVATVWPASSYFVDATSEPGRIVPRSGQTFPTATRVANGIEIVFKAGYGNNAQDVRREIRQGILMLIAHYYEQREPVVVGESVARTPAGVEALWRPFRIVAL